MSDVQQQSIQLCALPVFLALWSRYVRDGGEGRDVLESLAEGVVTYCQRLPDGERTVYLHADSLMKASGAAKVRYNATTLKKLLVCARLSFSIFVVRTVLVRVRLSFAKKC